MNTVIDRAQLSGDRGQPNGDLPLDVVSRKRAGDQNKSPDGGSGLAESTSSGVGRATLMRAAGLLLLVVAVVVGAVLRRLDANAAEAESNLAMVAADARPVTIALGRLEPAGEVLAVWAPSGSGDARIESLMVEVGDRVDRGATLAVLDNAETLQARANVATAQLSQAKTHLKQTRILTELSRSQASAKVARAKAELQTAESGLRRAKKLYGTTALSKQQLDDAQLLVQQTSAALLEAESQLARYAADTEKSIDVLVARAEVDAAAAKSAEAESLLQQARVCAPASGTVLQIESRPGNRASRGPVLSMGDTTVMMVRAELYESDVARIAVGQTATVRSPALPRPLHGQVSHIDSVVQRQSIVDSTPAANTDNRVVEALVRLDAESSVMAAKFVDLQVRVELSP